MTSKPVMITPQTSGTPKSRLRATAEPITSARSQAMIAISQRTQRTIDDRLRVLLAAGLREVLAGHHAELHAQRLQEHRHQVRQQDHPDEGVAELGAAGEVGRPVAGVHVADADQVAGAGEGEEAAPPPAMR